MKTLFGPGSAAGWLAALKMIGAAAVALGFISAVDMQNLGGIAAGMFVGMCAIVANYHALVKFFDHRGDLAALTPPPPEQKSFPRAAGWLLPFMLAAVAAGALECPLQAQPPKVTTSSTKACNIGNNNGPKTDPAVTALLQQMMSLQQQQLQATQANGQQLQQLALQIAALQAQIAALGRTSPGTPSAPMSQTYPGQIHYYQQPGAPIILPAPGPPHIVMPAPGPAPIIMPAPGPAPIVMPSPGPAPIVMPAPQGPPIVMPAPGAPLVSPQPITPMPPAVGGTGYQTFSRTRAIWPQPR